MARHELSFQFSPRNPAQILDQYLAEVGMGFNSYPDRQRRLHDIAALDALDDAELAAYGIERVDIPAFVYRDLLN